MEALNAQIELEKIEMQNHTYKCDFARSIAIWEDICMKLNSTKGTELKLWNTVMNLYKRKYK